MGDQMNWSALPDLVELFGVTDVESLIFELITIDKHLRDLERAKS